MVLLYLPILKLLPYLPTRFGNPPRKISQARTEIWVLWYAEFDTVAKDFIAPENGGFYVPECKSRVCYMS
eukprot:1546542-Rhodomonas_salina.1